MAYSIEASSDHCYEGTTCLINKLDIRDEGKLAEVEAAIVFGKVTLLDQQPIQGGFDLDHYKRIHHFLFCDLYEWAGQLREVNLSKKGTAFVPVDEIEPCAAACFKRLKEFQAEGLSRHELAVEMADFYHTINMLHPFREGSGRAQRVFFSQWIQHIGYQLDLTAVDSDEFIFATIQAAQGVMDPLIECFDRAIQPPQLQMDMTQTMS